MRLWTLIAAAACALASTGLSAQTYPTRPISFIVGSSPGGTADIIARTVGDAMSEKLGQPVVLDFVPGANALIAQQKAQRAAPDGYTIMLGSSTMVVAMITRPQLAVDMRSDLKPVIRLTSSTYGIIASPQSGFKTLQDVIDRARAQPGKVLFGSIGPGSTNHLIMEQLKSLTKTSMTHVPYRAEPQAFLDLLGGRIDILATSTPDIPMQKGAVPLAATSEQVWPLYTPMPTANATVPGFVANSWAGIFVPKDTPPQIIAALNAAANEALSRPAVKERLGQNGLAAAGGTPQAMEERVKEDYDLFSRIAKEQNLTFEQ